MASWTSFLCFQCAFFSRICRISLERKSDNRLISLSTNSGIVFDTTWYFIIRCSTCLIVAALSLIFFAISTASLIIGAASRSDTGTCPSDSLPSMPSKRPITLYNLPARSIGSPTTMADFILRCKISCVIKANSVGSFSEILSTRFSILINTAPCELLFSLKFTTFVDSQPAQPTRANIAVPRIALATDKCSLAESATALVAGGFEGFSLSSRKNTPWMHKKACAPKKRI